MEKKYVLGEVSVKEHSKPLISVVLGTYNRLAFLRLTVESIRHELAGIPSEIIVVDGGSRDGTVKWLLKQKDIITIVQHNHGSWKEKEVERRSWGYFMNLGFKCAQGTYVCMFNDDCLVVPGALKNGCDLFRREEAAGKKVGAVAFYCRDLPEQRTYSVTKTAGTVDINNGLFLRKALEEIGYIDEEAFMFYYADRDVVLRLREKGYCTIDSPDSYIEHYFHAALEVRASNQRTAQEDWESFVSRWGDVISLNKKGGFDCCIEREHVDAYATADKFKPLHARNIRYAMRKALRSCFEKLYGSAVIRKISDWSPSLKSLRRRISNKMVQ
jgi:GT2 family glycosyltransferase